VNPLNQKVESIMTNKHLTHTIIVDQNPDEVFAAINNVRGWWSGDIAGNTDKLGEEWTYRYGGLHYSKQKITESVPGKRVVWGVVDSYLSFVADKTEWNGTTITFEISRQGDKTRLEFTHVGLARDHECFTACSDAWSSYIKGSLRSLIATGEGRPNKKENEVRRSAQSRS
jgi:Activator of Hsp90 ATPase homolog 1-like protein